MYRSAALAGVLFLLLPPGANAQPNVRRAEQLASRGLDLYRQAAYEQAIDKFKESYALVPDPNNLFNIGKCYERMNRFEEAIEAYRRYIVEADNPTDRQEVQQRIANLEGRPARVTVSSTPPGATVYVDDTSGASAGRTPLTLELGTGPHVITLRMEGYEQSTRPLQGGFGREIGIDIAMARVRTGTDGEQTVVVREDGTTETVPVEPQKALHLGASLGVGLGSVGTEVTLTPTIAIGLRIGYGLELTPKVVLDLAASVSVEPRQAGTPAHSVTAFTALFEPGLRLQLASAVFLSAQVGFGAMNLVGLQDGDEFFANPESKASGALFTLLDVRAAVSLWVHVTEELAVAGTLGLDFSPERQGLVGDFLRFGGSAGVVYRF